MIICYNAFTIFKKEFCKMIKKSKKCLALSLFLANLVPYMGSPGVSAVKGNEGSIESSNHENSRTVSLCYQRSGYGGIVRLLLQICTDGMLDKTSLAKLIKEAFEKCDSLIERDRTQCNLKKNVLTKSNLEKLHKNLSNDNVSLDDLGLIAYLLSNLQHSLSLEELNWLLQRVG